MKNSKLTSSLLLVAAALILPACQESDPTPTPIQPRAEKMTYSFGTSQSYRVLEYDANGNLSSIISGLTDPEYGPQEYSHTLVYQANRLVSLVSEYESVVSFNYVYGSDGLLSETNAYYGNDLNEVYKFEYDDKGRVASKVTWNRNAESGSLQMVSKSEYEYDSHNNLIEERRFLHDGGAFFLTATFVYLDFDTKKSSEHLFMTNLQHPFVQFFQNNPQTLKLTNGNGTSAEQKFTYEYNSDGQVIKKWIEGGDDSYEYKFELMD